LSRLPYFKFDSEFAELNYHQPNDLPFSMCLIFLLYGSYFEYAKVTSFVANHVLCDHYHKVYIFAVSNSKLITLHFPNNASVVSNRNIYVT